MNLLIDIGNSLTKVAISNNKKIIKEFKFKKFEVSDLINILNDIILHSQPFQMFLNLMIV